MEGKLVSVVQFCSYSVKNSVRKRVEISLLIPVSFLRLLIFQFIKWFHQLFYRFFSWKLPWSPSPSIVFCCALRPPPYLREIDGSRRRRTVLVSQRWKWVWHGDVRSSIVCDDRTILARGAYVHTGHSIAVPIGWCDCSCNWHIVAANCIYAVIILSLHL